MKSKKEKIKFYVLGFITPIIIGGLILGIASLIDKHEQKEISKEEKIDGITYEISYEYKNEKVCDAYKDLWSFANNGFITNDGHFYITSDKKFSSNNQNCQLANENIIIKSIIGNDVYVSQDGSKYMIEFDGNETPKFKKHNDYYIRAIPTALFNDNVKQAVRYDETYDEKTQSTTLKYYVLKTDGKLYDMVFTSKYNNYNSKYAFTILKDELYQSFENEVIKKYNISQVKDMRGYIFTDKNIYIQEAINKECYEFEDIKCNYEFKKNNYLNKYVNNIIEFNYYGNTIDLTTSNNNRISIRVTK